MSMRMGWPWVVLACACGDGVVATETLTSVDAGTDAVSDEDAGVDAGNATEASAPDDAGVDALPLTDSSTPIDASHDADADAISPPTGFACYGAYPNGTPINCYWDNEWTPNDGGVCATLQPYGQYHAQPHCPATSLVGCCACTGGGRITGTCYYSSPTPACGPGANGFTCAWQTTPL